MASIIETLYRHELIPERQDAYAEEWAAYKRALLALLAHDPERLALTYGNPLCALDEEVVALVEAAWRAGAAAGDAFARAERSLERDHRVCPRCQGYGRRLHDEAHARFRAAERPCATCAGNGVVPLEATG